MLIHVAQMHVCISVSSLHSSLEVFISCCGILLEHSVYTHHIGCPQVHQCLVVTLFRRLLVIAYGDHLIRLNTESREVAMPKLVDSWSMHEQCRPFEEFDRLAGLLVDPKPILIEQP